VFYQLKNGCSLGRFAERLAALLHGKWHYKHWRSQGVFDQILRTLHSQVRIDAPKKTTLAKLTGKECKLERRKY
jgi:hypothetical protein